MNSSPAKGRRGFWYGERSPRECTRVSSTEWVDDYMSRPSSGIRRCAHGGEPEAPLVAHERHPNGRAAHVTCRFVLSDPVCVLCSRYGVDDGGRSVMRAQLEVHGVGVCSRSCASCTRRSIVSSCVRGPNQSGFADLGPRRKVPIGRFASA